MKNYCNVIYIKKNGKLVPADFGQREILKEFRDTLQEGEKVEVLMETRGPQRTKLQLAKIHASISELAKESGYTNQEMKNIIKVRANLLVKEDGKEYLRSFADCDREELSEVIKTIEWIAEQYNVNLKGKLISLGYHPD